MHLSRRYWFKLFVLIQISRFKIFSSENRQNITKLHWGMTRFFVRCAKRERSLITMCQISKSSLFDRLFFIPKCRVKIIWLSIWVIIIFLYSLPKIRKFSKFLKIRKFLESHGILKYSDNYDMEISENPENLEKSENFTIHKLLKVWEFSKFEKFRNFFNKFQNFFGADSSEIKIINNS